MDTTSSSLLVRIKAKDEEAWRRFSHLYGPLVHRWCSGFGLQDADIADVGQDVFRTVAESIARFHKNEKGDSFRAWLKAITRTRAIDHMRRKERASVGVGGSAAQQRMLAIADCRSDLESSDLDDEQLLSRRAIDMVLDSCEEETRQAFLRVVVGREHPADVARDLGMTANAIYVAKSRILRRIRHEFAELVDF